MHKFDQQRGLMQKMRWSGNTDYKFKFQWWIKLCFISTHCHAYTHPKYIIRSASVYISTVCVLCDESVCFPFLVRRLRDLCVGSWSGAMSKFCYLTRQVDPESNRRRARPQKRWNAVIQHSNTAFTAQWSNKQVSAIYSAYQRWYICLSLVLVTIPPRRNVSVLVRK